MAPKKSGPEVPAEVRARAREIQAKLAHKPGPDEFLTPQERADPTPFYFVLRGFVKQLKDAREAAGLPLAQIAERTGMAPESLSRLETGALTNPTFQTLARYALAVGRKPVMTSEPIDGC
ncbi:MAG: helix-turn-helix protein [Gemmataceae bacterium]|nr:helix-turn-helix protein [Gemmataceae bacterium]